MSLIIISGVLGSISICSFLYNSFKYYHYVLYLIHFYLIIIAAISDIGSASFKYDMRRLTEILAFPKAWYRRSIVRRMFLGDLSMSATHNDDSVSDATAGSPAANSKNQTKNASEKSPLLNNKDKLKLSLDGERQTKLKDVGKTTSVDSSESPSPTDLKSCTSWETLVLFAVNFKKLNVHMNMGNVMGNVM